MKKVLLMVVLFSALLFAAEFENPKSVVRQGTELRLGKKYISFRFGESCFKDFIQCSDSVHTGDFAIFNGIAYYSTLDTNMVVFVDFDNCSIKIHHTLAGLFIRSSYPLKQILKQEFLNLQEWGVFDISKDSASTLIDRIIFEMQGGECDWNGIDDSSYINANIDIFDAISFTHDEYCDSLECCGSPVDGGAVMVDNWWTLLPEKKPTSISKTPIKNRFRLSRMNHETFFVEGINEATPYKVFDVNGILLKQGQTENGQIYVPKTPSILDIEHKKVLLK